MRIVSFGAVLVVFAVTSAAEQPDERHQLAAVLLDALNMEAQISQKFQNSKAALRQLVPPNAQPAGPEGEKLGPSPEEMKEFVDHVHKTVTAELKWDNVKADYVNLYAEMFSAEELKDMVTFYRSPAGRALVEKQPELTRKSFEMDQKAVMRIMPKMMAFRPEVKKKEMPEPVEGAK